MKIIESSLIGALLFGLVNMGDEFDYNEFVYSETAHKHGIKNVPSESQIQNGKALYENIVIPIREKFGNIRVTSAFRNPKLNTMVGGVPDSQHMSGQAIDIQTPGISRYQVAHWVIENLEYDQLILEPTWLHISYSTTNNRKENLKYYRGSLIPYEYK